MESTNNDDLHLQQHHNKLQDHDHDDHLARSSSIVVPSSLAFPSLCDVEGNNCEHAWRSSSTFFLNNNNIHANSIEAPPNTFNNSMIQDLRYSLPNNINNIIIQSTSYNEHHHHHQHLISNKIKEESSTSSDQSNSSSFQTFGELLSPSTNTPNEMLLLNTLSPTYKNHMFHPSQFQPNIQFQDNNSNSNSNSDLPGITTFSQIFPSVNISKLSSSAMDSSNFRSNLDLLASQQRSVFSGRSLNQAPHSNLLELFKDSSQYVSVDDHDLQQSNDNLRLCNASTHLSSFNNNGILEPKRSSCIVEPNSSHQSVSKKQRFETRGSCPPFKVRKEKLGDRIAALQQLVAPFGKTDTASVLSEAIGYIKFLQNQIETLSVPYMKLGSRNRSSNNLHRISDEIEAIKQDLRSRGLCLVPLTCLSYITSDCEITGPSAWPPPHNFNSGF